MQKKSKYQLSIITINYNDAVGLAKTMESVKHQTFRDFEHIVIDGNSSDNSLDIIKSYNYPNLQYVSEPDSGIYNAMNKGIRLAFGNFLLFLNSGDYLFNSKVLENANPYFQTNFSIFSGNIIFDEQNEKRLREHPEQMTFSYLVGNAISHPSTFIKRELFDKYGLYDESFKIVSDWAFFLKVLGLNNEIYTKLPETITVFDTTGISTKKENFSKAYAERGKVLETYFPRVFNNEKDTYVFNKFINTSKRFKYLQTIENYPLFRKLATLQLGFSHWLIKLFKQNQ